MYHDGGALEGAKHIVDQKLESAPGIRIRRLSTKGTVQLVAAKGEIDSNETGLGRA